MGAIVDYGVGNLFSLTSSFAAIGVEAEAVRDPAALARASRLVLPGVGAFADAARALRESGLQETVLALARSGKPLLGICLGMQLLLERSYEYGEHPGLGLIPGEVRPIAETIPPDLKIPHIGWNALRFAGKPCPLFRGVPEGSYVYFVHSYAGTGCGEAAAALTDYGAPLTAAVWRENVYGCQFHPEKSGPVGLRILRNFCETEGEAC